MQLFAAVPFIRCLLIVIAASLLTVTGMADAAPRPGRPAPGFTATSTSGHLISFESYRGQVLILDFFATWCQPCRMSIPHLVEMNRKYSKQGLQIVGLIVDEESERSVKSFADEFRINYPLAVAGSTVTADYGVRSVPTMFLIGKDGKVAEVYRGFSGESAGAVERSIRRLLAEK